MTPRGAVLDLDGTIYRGGEALPGAPEAVEALRTADLDLLCFSNNPTRTREDYVEHLAGMDVLVTADEVLSAGVVTTEHVRTEHGGDDVFLVGSPGLRDQLGAAGCRLTDDPRAADVLVASWTREFDYGDLTAALRALDEETAFVGSDPDRTVPASDGRLVPGSGAIIGAIAAATEREPDRVMGKPSPEAIEAVREHLPVPASDCLLVGDRLDTDIAMGDRAGMTTVLVLTGVCDRADVRASEVTPDHVVESLAEVPSLLS
ncbi:MAG: HAD-IIA family hydrolase [Halorientalis sp.]